MSKAEVPSRRTFGCPIAIAQHLTTPPGRPSHHDDRQPMPEWAGSPNGPAATFDWLHRVLSAHGQPETRHPFTVPDQLTAAIICHHRHLKPNFASYDNA